MRMWYSVVVSTAGVNETGKGKVRLLALDFTISLDDVAAICR